MSYPRKNMFLHQTVAYMKHILVQQTQQMPGELIRSKATRKISQPASCIFWNSMGVHFNRNTLFRKINNVLQ